LPACRQSAAAIFSACDPDTDRSPASEFDCKFETHAMGKQESKGSHGDHQGNRVKEVRDKMLKC
jgi:hypothetical protein